MVVWEAKPCHKSFTPANLSNFSETIYSIKISPEGVLKLMQNININKATGPDDIPGKLLQICASELYIPFSILFQKSIDSGTVPDEWKPAHIFPLFKKGDRSSPANYRPVSIICISCKLLEHIIHSTISDFLDRQNFLTQFQHGFHQKRSLEIFLVF